MITHISKKLLVATLTITTLACSQLDAMKRLREYSGDEQGKAKKPRLMAQQANKSSDSSSSSDELPIKIDVITNDNAVNNQPVTLTPQDDPDNLNELISGFETLSMDVEVINNRQARQQPLNRQDVQAAAQNLKLFKGWVVRQWNRLK